MNIFTKAILSMATIATMSHAANNVPAQIVATTDGIDLEVRYEKVYPSSRDVTITYTIINKSDSPIKRFQADEMLDLSIHLTSPSGKALTRFVDQEGAVVQKYQLKRLFVEDIPPTGRSDGRINLALHYPLTEEGMYSCILGRKVYYEDPSIVRTGALDPPGKPFELVNQPFEFSIQTIDPTFKPPFSKIEIVKAPATSSGAPNENAGAPSVSVSEKETVSIPPDSPSQTEKEATHRSEGKFPWVLFVVLIASIAGFLWMVFKKRK